MPGSHARADRVVGGSIGSQSTVRRVWQVARKVVRLTLDLLEDKITAKAFAENLLGFEDYEDDEDEESADGVPDAWDRYREAVSGDLASRRWQAEPDAGQRGPGWVWCVRCKTWCAVRGERYRRVRRGSWRRAGRCVWCDAAVSTFVPAAEVPAPRRLWPL